MANNYKQALPAGAILRGGTYDYRIRSVLGQGSFGITYLASTSIKGPLGEVTVPVAVKEFFASELDSRRADGSVVSRTEQGVAHKYAKAFQRESQNLSKLKHPGIVNVLEAFEANGTYYYSMEYLPGGSLDAKVKGVGMPEAEALEMMSKIGDALSYLHDHKMMHLDLKPKNIMLKDDGSPVIIDFGLSKQYDNEGEPESSSTIGLGTPGYAPLEQSNSSSGRLFQPTLDIYALGATLFKMLTGQTPPDASTILVDGLPEEALKAKDVSASIIATIAAAMRPSWKDRPQTVAGFLSMLDENSAKHEENKDKDTEDDTRPIPVPKPAPKPVPDPDPGLDSDHGRKSKTWLWALLGGLAALAVILSFVFGGENRKQDAGGDSAADTLAFAPAEPFSETPISPSVNDPVPEALGSIKITSEPSGAIIWLDGKNTGKKTPEILENITPGKHAVRLSLDGYMEYKGNVTVPSGKSASLNRTLTIKDDLSPASANDLPKDNVIVSEWVDLGLPSGTLWKSNNESGFFSFDEAVNRFGKQLPTKENWEELVRSCKWTWAGNRYQVTGPNGKTIIIPASGRVEDNGTVENVGGIGYCWSSTVDKPGAVWYLTINSHGVRFSLYGSERCSVHLVQNANVF